MDLRQHGLLVLGTLALLIVLTFGLVVEGSGKGFEIPLAIDFLALFISLELWLLRLRKRLGVGIFAGIGAVIFSIMLLQPLFLVAIDQAIGLVSFWSIVILTVLFMLFLIPCIDAIVDFTDKPGNGLERNGNH